MSKFKVTTENQPSYIIEADKIELQIPHIVLSYMGDIVAVVNNPVSVIKVADDPANTIRFNPNTEFTYADTNPQ